MLAILFHIQLFSISMRGNLSCVVNCKFCAKYDFYLTSKLKRENAKIIKLAKKLL